MFVSHFSDVVHIAVQPVSCRWDSAAIEASEGCGAGGRPCPAGENLTVNVHGICVTKHGDTKKE